NRRADWTLAQDAQAARQWIWRQRSEETDAATGPPNGRTVASGRVPAEGVFALILTEAGMHARRLFCTAARTGMWLRGSGNLAVSANFGGIYFEGISDPL